MENLISCVKAFAASWAHGLMKRLKTHASLWQRSMHTFSSLGQHWLQIAKDTWRSLGVAFQPAIIRPSVKSGLGLQESGFAQLAWYQMSRDLLQIARRPSWEPSFTGSTPAPACKNSARLLLGSIAPDVAWIGSNLCKWQPGFQRAPSGSPAPCLHAVLPYLPPEGRRWSCAFLHHLVHTSCSLTPGSTDPEWEQGITWELVRNAELGLCLKSAGSEAEL